MVGAILYMATIFYMAPLLIVVDAGPSKMRRDTSKEALQATSAPVQLQYGLSYLSTGGGSSRFSAGFHSCALIGSGATLQGKGLGHAIDSFDTVIRVNRLPTQSLSLDLGHKVTILFASREAVKVNSTHIFYTETEGHGAKPKHVCQRGFNGSPACQFKFLVIRDDTMNLGDDALGPTVMPEILTQQFLPEVSEATRRIISDQPTTGFHAFLTMAHACDSMRLFGFGPDNATIDGHMETWRLQTSSSLTKEHEFYSAMSTGNFESLRHAGWPHSVIELAGRQRGNILHEGTLR